MLVFTEINNWKELVSQFSDKSQGAMTALELRKELTLIVRSADKPKEHVAIEYNKKLTEAVALFVYKTSSVNRYSTLHYYDYMGTAN